VPAHVGVQRILFRVESLLRQFFIRWIRRVSVEADFHSLDTFRLPQNASNTTTATTTTTTTTHSSLI
jgi:hypothetical protein